MFKSISIISVFWNQTGRFGRKLQLETLNHAQIHVQETEIFDRFRRHFHRSRIEKRLQGHKRGCATRTSDRHRSPFPFAAPPNGVSQVSGLVLFGPKDSRCDTRLYRRRRDSIEIVQEIFGTQVPRSTHRSSQWPLRKRQSP